MATSTSVYDGLDGNRGVDEVYNELPKKPKPDPSLFKDEPFVPNKHRPPQIPNRIAMNIRRHEDHVKRQKAKQSDITNEVPPKKSLLEQRRVFEELRYQKAHYEVVLFCRDVLDDLMERVEELVDEQDKAERAEEAPIAHQTADKQELVDEQDEAEETEEAPITHQTGDTQKQDLEDVVDRGIDGEILDYEEDLETNSWERDLDLSSDEFTDDENLIVIVESSENLARKDLEEEDQMPDSTFVPDILVVSDDDMEDVNDMPAEEHHESLPDDEDIIVLSSDDEEAAVPVPLHKKRKVTVTKATRQLLLEEVTTYCHGQIIEDTAKVVNYNNVEHFTLEY